ncbi:hypothetical protein BSKO_08446 [Bryopsis sp. KO-2023]|nr:hypothetical protein BSKO_08446 [Bryopsis sp. KO-2023]
MLIPYLTSLLAVSIVLVPMCSIVCMLLWSCRARFREITNTPVQPLDIPHVILPRRTKSIEGLYAIVLDPSGNVAIGVQAPADGVMEDLKTRDD